MTGSATFSEVFLTEARVPHANVIGTVDDGWSVARTTLSNERNSFGGGGEGGGALVGSPNLAGRVGDLVDRSKAGATGGETMTLGGGVSLITSLPRLFGRQNEPVVRQEVARIYSARRIAGYTAQRAQTAAARGGRPGAAGSTSKLAASNTTRLIRDTGLRIEGAYGMLVGPDAPWMASSRTRRFSVLPRRSPAAPTRSSATSSASGCSGCRRNQPSMPMSRIGISPSAPRSAPEPRAKLTNSDGRSHARS